MNKEQLTLKEKIIVAVITIIFISPAFIVQEGPRILYIFLVGISGWSIGKRIIFYLRMKNELVNKNRVSLLLSNFTINIYLVIYLITLIIVDFIFLQEKLLLYLLKIIVSTHFLFYSGLKGLQTKTMYFRGGQMSKKSSIVNAIILILFAILSLVYNLIFK